MRSRLLVLILGYVVSMMLTASVVASASWSFQGVIQDDENDNGNYPAFTDIVKVEYGFNETHFSVNVTTRGGFNLNEKETLWIGVLIDSDMNSDTGYGYGNIGANHLLEAWLTAGPRDGRLYGYTGQGSNWNWSRLENTVYMDVRDNTVSMIAEKGSITFPKGEIKIIVYTTYASSDEGSITVDTTNPTIFPIPEHLIIPIVVGFTAFVILYRIRDRLPM